MPANIPLVGKALGLARREYERLKLGLEVAGGTDKYGWFLKYADTRRVPNGILPPLAGK